MVAIGTLISTFWILASNSWMQTPQGFEIVDGRVMPLDWLAIVFNPSFPFRLAHMAIAAFVATAFFVGSSAAWHLLRGNNTAPVRRMFSMALWMALIVAPIQAVVGDAHGLNTLEHQPAKIAAIEGHWENADNGPTPLVLFGIPDMQAEKTKYALEIPYLGSLILTHSLDKQIPALKSFPKEDRPNSTIIFWSFRVMAGLGMLMILVGVLGLALRRGGKLYQHRGFQRLVLLMGPSGLIALLAGWITTEVGRQPWVVYGLMRTHDAASHHSVAQMSTSLLLFVVIYCSVFTVGIGYMMKLVRKGPQPHHEHPPEGDQLQTPRRPISAATAPMKEH
jgi:cytochrome d ubiquinol oxidase subunit I